MKVTGQQLIAAIKEWSHVRDMATAEFSMSNHRFPGDQKDSPAEVSARIVTAEGNVAKLQAAQGAFNQRIKVTVDGETLSLAEAIKRIGGVSRVEKLWREVAKGDEKKRRRSSLYGDDIGLVRSKKDDVERAEILVTPAEANLKAKEIAKKVALLRSAIQAGNARKTEIEGLEPALFE